MNDDGLQFFPGDQITAVHSDGTEVKGKLRGERDDEHDLAVGSTTHTVGSLLRRGFIIETTWWASRGPILPFEDGIYLPRFPDTGTRMFQKFEGAWYERSDRWELATDSVIQLISSWFVAGDLWYLRAERVEPEVGC